MLNRSVRRRRLAIRVAFTLVIVSISGWGIYRLISYGQERIGGMIMHARTLRLVGAVALAYLRDNGAPPTSVDDLFAAGYLRRESDGFVCIYRVPGDPNGSMPDTYVSSVRFRFPKSANGYRLASGGVVDDASGAKVVIVDMPAGVVRQVDLERINDMLSVAWFHIMEGKPSGLSFVDGEAAVDRAAAQNKDRLSTSAPSP